MYISEGCGCGTLEHYFSWSSLIKNAWIFYSRNNTECGSSELTVDDVSKFLTCWEQNKPTNPGPQYTCKYSHWRAAWSRNSAWICTVWRHDVFFQFDNTYFLPESSVAIHDHRKETSDKNSTLAWSRVLNLEVAGNHTHNRRWRYL